MTKNRVNNLFKLQQNTMNLHKYIMAVHKMKSRTITTILLFKIIMFYIDFPYHVIKTCISFCSKIFIKNLLQIKLELYRVFINY